MKYHVYKVPELFDFATGYLLIREDDNYCYVDVEKDVGIDVLQEGFDEEGIDEMADVESAILATSDEKPEYLETVSTLEECITYIKTYLLLEE